MSDWVSENELFSIEQVAFPPFMRLNVDEHYSAWNYEECTECFVRSPFSVGNEKLIDFICACLTMVVSLDQARTFV